MGQETTHYFAYGSNMDPRRMAERDIRFEAADAARLRDYRLRFNKRSVSMKGSAAANVMPAAGEEVEGVLYRLVDSAQIGRLDPFEGYPDGYRREQLAVERKGGGVTVAWVYLANPHYLDDTLQPRRAYLQHLLAGRPFLSPRYYARLRRVACSDDASPEVTRGRS